MKKGFVLFVLITVLAGSVFAGGKQPKHLAGDILLGIDLGLGMTPSIGKVRNDTIPAGNYAMAFDIGLNFDYYMFKWLSFNTGAFAHAGIYLFLDNLKSLDYSGRNLTDIAKTPICFTVPVMTHINIPGVSFLYLGAGITLNFPVASMLDSDYPEIDTKGGFFIGIPLDFGFDFVKAGKGGGRFFFRVTPEFHHGGGKPLLVGFMWQIYNFKLHSRKPSGEEKK